MKRKFLHTFVALALLLAPCASAGAQQVEGATLTDDERREAGEFLLRLDERWRESRDLPALFDEMFVGDFVALARGRTSVIEVLPVDKELSAALTEDQFRRAAVANLDVMYLAGRIYLTFELRKKSAKAADDAPPCEEQEAASCKPSGRGDTDSSVEEVFSPAVVEVFNGNPQLRALLAEDQDGGEGGDEGPEITTTEQLLECVETLERAAVKMRARLKELEAGLPGPPPSAVPREDEDEGELPDLELTVLSEEWMGRAAGTRVVCGYVSTLHVDLVEEGGRYKVLAAYVKDYGGPGRRGRK